jgi:hypothetical protein
MPGYWMFETSGVLKPAIEAYLARDELTPAEIAAIRAYLRQWIDGPWHAAPGAEARVLERLRRMVDELDTRQKINIWLTQALSIDIDPL